MDFTSSTLFGFQLTSGKRGLIILGKEDGGYGAIGFSDDPESDAVCPRVGREEPGTFLKCPVIGLSIMSVQFTPISRLMARDSGEDISFGEMPKGIGCSNDPAEPEPCSRGSDAHSR